MRSSGVPCHPHLRGRRSLTGRRRESRAPHPFAGAAVVILWRWAALGPAFSANEAGDGPPKRVRRPLDVVGPVLADATIRLRAKELGDAHFSLRKERNLLSNIIKILRGEGGQ